jgi:hypothetical protein
MDAMIAAGVKREAADGWIEVPCRFGAELVFGQRQANTVMRFCVVTGHTSTFETGGRITRFS